MRFHEEMTDARMLVLIGSRLTQLRLSRDLTQQQVADEAGIGLRTLQRMEAGEVASRLSGFVGVCRVLGLSGRFGMLLPEVPLSPMDQLKLQGKRRERASGKKKVETGSLREGPSEWKWGDEK
jgi:transcriptional regulator with XRE-family HTH domain